jgi:hypothetical protein
VGELLPGMHEGQGARVLGNPAASSDPEEPQDCAVCRLAKTQSQKEKEEGHLRNETGFLGLFKQGAKIYRGR